MCKVHIGLKIQYDAHFFITHKVISFVRTFTGTLGLGIATVIYQGKDYGIVRFVGTLHFGGDGVVPAGNFNLVETSEEFGFEGIYR
jgi:hypothetical protein